METIYLIASTSSGPLRKDWDIKVPENLEHLEKEFTEAIKQTEDIENIEIDYSYVRDSDHIFFWANTRHFMANGV